MKQKTTLWIMAMVMGLALSAHAQAAEKEEKAEQKSKNPVVKMETSKGDIIIELYQDKAPITVANFLKYTEDKFYNGTVFHRVIKGFMIQGGGMTENLQKKKTKPPIKNESYNKVRNARGTIAMARTNAPDSATSQFFINHVNNRGLDFDGPYAPGYAVFGKVIKGMDIVDKIALIPTKPIGPHRNVPVETVLIKSVTVVKTDDDKEDDKDEKKDEHEGHDHD